MSTTPAPDSSSGRRADEVDDRSRGRKGEGRAGRAQWKVPVAILLGAVTGVVLAVVNGLQLAS